jgi:ABC-2 type transport system permease protein
MRKILTIARREFEAMVGTKAFLLSITLMPILMFGGVLVASRMQKFGDVSDKRIVIADGTGGAMFDVLAEAAEQRNTALASAKSDPADDDDDESPQAKYVLERNEKDVLQDADRLALSDRVRDGAIKAFVEIPAKLLDASDTAAATTPLTVEYFAPAAMFSEERGWVERVINEAVKAQRFQAMNLDPAVVARATASVPVEGRGLVKKLDDGRVGGGEEGRNMMAVFLPFGFMMLMFMVIMMSAQPLLESVMEEKSGRIAEVLLGSVNSFQLLLGKLLGNVAGSLTVVAIYAAGGYALAAYNGWTDSIPWDLVPWFLVYQVLCVLLFSSIFMAVGSAVTQLKEAQSMLLPVWLLMCIPMFVWLQAVREPNGPLATGLSFFPPATALMMVLRLASEEVVPSWQIAASLAILVVTTLAITFLAARVFRVGMLWQGKTPKMHELARWALRG